MAFVATAASNSTAVINPVCQTDEAFLSRAEKVTAWNV